MNDPMNPQAPGAAQPPPGDPPHAPRGTCAAVVEVLKLALILAAVFGAIWLAMIAWVIYQAFHM